MVLAGCDGRFFVVRKARDVVRLSRLVSPSVLTFARCIYRWKRGVILRWFVSGWGKLRNVPASLSGSLSVLWLRKEVSDTNGTVLRVVCSVSASPRSAPVVNSFRGFS